jgi:hypothetical protein
MRNPLDPFSKVLDEQSHWDPEWYSWLTDLTASIAALQSSITALQSPIPGSVIGSGYGETTTFLSTAAQMAGGADTIPQQTDGMSLLTATITPKAATSKLRVSVTAPASSDGLFGFWFALFRDSTAPAIAATAEHVAAGSIIMTVAFGVQVPSNSTAPTTFRLRFGNFNTVTQTVTVNGNPSSGRRLGGSLRVQIEILELA